MKKTLLLLAAAFAGLLLPSCSMNPLDLGYRSTPGIPKRDWVNGNPSLIQASYSGHNSYVNNYTRKGYSVIGYGEMNARYEVDAQNARMLAVEKNADVAVFSRRDLGTHTERVAVPVTTTTSEGYAEYQNSNQYASQAQAGAQTTVYAYQNQQYRLFGHKTTLLRKNP